MDQRHYCKTQISETVNTLRHRLLRKYCQQQQFTASKSFCTSKKTANRVKSSLQNGRERTQQTKQQKKKKKKTNNPTEPIKGLLK